MDPDLNGLCDHGVQGLREKVAETILDDDVLENQAIQMATLPDIDSAEEPDPIAWLADMKIDGNWVDNAFIQLFSNWIRRDIMILPLYPDDGHHGWIKISAKSSNGKIYMLYYPNKHYQSIVPKIEKTVIDDNTSQIKTLDQVEQVEIKTLDQQRSTKKLKVSVDTSEERNSNQLNKNSSPYNLRRR